MRLIGVLDILRGEVVRAVAGQRQHYQPLTSRWTRSTQPLDVAKALVDTFGLRELYLADLDAILRGQPNWRLWEALCRLNVQIWLDAGLRTWSEVSKVVHGLNVCPVVGLETWQDICPEPHKSSQPTAQLFQRAIMFSLDACRGQWLASEKCLQQRGPAEIAAWAWRSGFEHLLALDLAAVGTGQLHWTIRLLEAARPGAPQAHWYVGGGVSNLEDLEHLQSMDVSGCLVASALHDGRILPAQVRAFVQV